MTIDLLARIAANGFTITHQQAADALENYRKQMEAIDGRTIDPDNLTKEDASFIYGSLVSALEAGDIIPADAL